MRIVDMYTSWESIWNNWAHAHWTAHAHLPKYNYCYHTYILYEQYAQYIFHSWTMVFLMQNLFKDAKHYELQKVVHGYIKTNTMYKYYKVKAGSARSINAYLCSWKLNLMCRLHMYLQVLINRSANLKT